MIYGHPDFDAAVAIERRGSIILLDFLARGRSQRRADGNVVGYTQRNPERRKLVDHVLALLPGVFKHVSKALGPRHLRPVLGAAGGKGAPVTVFDPPLRLDDPAVRASYSASGNYRWRLWIRCGAREAAFAAVLGLEANEHHRPVTTNWPDELTQRSKP